MLVPEKYFSGPFITSYRSQGITAQYLTLALETMIFNSGEM